MLTGYMENTIGFSNVEAAPFGAHMSSLPQKAPSKAVRCGPIHTDTQVEMSRCCSTNGLTEEQPSWLEDLLSEPETPVSKGHRRSSSDPFTCLEVNNRPDETWLGSIGGEPTWGLQIPHYFKGETLSNRKPATTQEPQDLLKPSSTFPRLPNVFKISKEDAEYKALGLFRSPPERERTTFAGSTMQGQADAASHTSENSSVGSHCSQMKPLAPPPAPMTDVKRKQHNARRSRVRKLQYIAELERNVQVLQVQGVEVSAQMEFLDQQNLILGMENRALKQRLESLSQEQLIKSFEQEILDRELGRLQYMYHMRNLNHHQQRLRQNQNPGAHRRGRSCDLDSQFAKLSLNRQTAIAASNGFRDFPYRN